jgi:hypothetical protein
MWVVQSSIFGERVLWKVLGESVTHLLYPLVC